MNWQPCNSISLSLLLSKVLSKSTVIRCQWCYVEDEWFQYNTTQPPSGRYVVTFIADYFLTAPSNAGALNGDALTALGAARIQNTAASFGTHPGTETVRSLAV